jgi:hypothetical protein
MKTNRHDIASGSPLHSPLFSPTVFPRKPLEEYPNLKNETLHPFLAITVEHLSYLTQIIEIWILKYPIKVQAIPDLTLKNI